MVYIRRILIMAKQVGLRAVPRCGDSRVLTQWGASTSRVFLQIVILDIVLVSF